MAQPSGRAGARFFLLSALVTSSLLGQGCSGSKGPNPDQARLDTCVLMGATTNDGCELAVAGGPGIRLGDLTMGAVKSRDIALYNGGGGQVATTVSAVTIEGPAGSTVHYAVAKLFKLDAALAEVPVTLPYDLAAGHGGELRVRVVYTANEPVGAVSGVSVKVVASHPAVSVLVPITGNITGCPTGRGDCDRDPSNGCEVDLQTAIQNCGACGAVCGSANATSVCNAGTCQITCATGFGNCDGNAANGCETNLNADPAHCSACGTACNATNGTPSCAAGVCGITCATGFADCDGNPANGCEVNLSSDVAHCGACGAVCGSANATSACNAGTCQITCATGFGNCDGNPANGCEVNLATDPAHCGTCATACNRTNGTATCTAGACGITCAAGFANCDGLLSNGCEVNLTSDPAHCGACATVCNATNGTATCTAGACGITCAAGFGNCDGILSNGCEVNLTSDPAHCGACTTVCNATNGTATCAAGACGITCSAGFGNCDGLLSNGCEVNLTSDLNHCGTCATVCGTANATASCTAGACGLVCKAGYADCNRTNSDGCEVNLLLDTSNCGVCGLVCSTPNATPTCAGGTCAIATCNAGWANCDGNPANGCEVNLGGDVMNCGLCGNVCSTANGTPACTAGSCQVGTCNAGWANCDGNPANGCETNTTSNVNACGGCGKVCTPGANVATEACVASACTVATCAAGWYDMNGVNADGCECAGDANSATCAAPTALGTIALAASATISGALAPNGRVEYFTVTFPSNGVTSYHPKISITSPSGIARFDVLSDCAGTAAGACGIEAGTSLGVTTWETFYTGGDPTNFYGSFRPVPPPGNGGTVIVKVYASASTATCGTFTLTVSN